MNVTAGAGRRQPSPYRSFLDRTAVWLPGGMAARGRSARRFLAAGYDEGDRAGDGDEEEASRRGAAEKDFDAGEQQHLGDAGEDEEAVADRHINPRQRRPEIEHLRPERAVAQQQARMCRNGASPSVAPSKAATASAQPGSRNDTVLAATTESPDARDPRGPSAPVIRSLRSRTRRPGASRAHPWPPGVNLARTITI